MKSDGSTADYYKLPEGATELQHLISHRDMNAQIGEVFRACYRYGQASHSDRLRDAKKIRFYAQAEIERLEKLAPPVTFDLADSFDEDRVDRVASSHGDGEHYDQQLSASLEAAEDFNAAPPTPPAADDDIIGR